MNLTLRKLFKGVGSDSDARLRRPWTTFLIHKNLGAVPTTDMPSGKFYWNRGFLVLLIDEHGRPTHVCKVRPEAEASTRHESLVMARLSTDVEVGLFVPPAYWGSIPGIQILVTPFVPGGSYHERLGKLSLGAWSSDMEEILTISDQISRRAAEIVPELFGGVRHVNLLEAAKPALSSLATLGIEAVRLERLVGCLSSVPATEAILQHGDLWPGNLLYNDGHWTLLDFEAFGNVTAPLFDALHLLRTSMALREGGSTQVPWVRQLQSANIEVAACRRLLAAAVKRAHINPSLASACLVFYLATFTHRCKLVHLSPREMELLFAEIRAAADLLAEHPQSLAAYFAME